MYKRKSIETLALNTTRGELFKLSVWAKRWKSRYFVLKGNSLQFFQRKEDRDRQEVPRGTIDMLDATVEAQDEPKRRKSSKKGVSKPQEYHVIMIKPSRGKHKTRGVFLAASSKAEQDTWVLSLKRHTKKKAQVVTNLHLTKLEELVNTAGPDDRLTRSRIACDLLIDEGRYVELIDELIKGVITPLRDTMKHFKREAKKKAKRRGSTFFRRKKQNKFKPLEIKGLTHKGFAVDGMHYTARDIEKALPQPGLMTSILFLHKRIFGTLRNTAESWTEAKGGLGSALKEFAPFFRMYQGYSECICSLTFMLGAAAMRPSNTFAPEFADILDFLNGEHNDGLADGTRMAVERMLLAPLQRMQQYSATLQRLLDATPSGHPDKVPLEQTLAHFRPMVQPMAQAYARARETCELYRVQAQLHYYQITQKITSTKSKFLLREAVNCVVTESNGAEGNRSSKQLVVLSNMVMICECIKNIDAQQSMHGTSLVPIWISDLSVPESERSVQTFRLKVSGSSFQVIKADGISFRVFDLSPDDMRRVCRALRSVMKL